MLGAGEPQRGIAGDFYRSPSFECFCGKSPVDLTEYNLKVLPVELTWTCKSEVPGRTRQYENQYRLRLIGVMEEVEKVRSTDLKEEEVQGGERKGEANLKEIGRASCRERVF